MPFAEDQERRLVQMSAEVVWLKAALRTQQRAAELWEQSPSHINDWAVEHRVRRQRAAAKLYFRARAGMEMYCAVQREFESIWGTDRCR